MRSQESQPNETVRRALSALATGDGVDAGRVRAPLARHPPVSERVAGLGAGSPGAGTDRDASRTEDDVYAAGDGVGRRESDPESSEIGR